MRLPVLVLAAGLGTRLDPLTRLLAKPAVPLGDSTLIEHVLGWLQRHEVHDVVLNLHHRPATITRIVGDGAHLGLSAKYSWEQPILGSAGGPRRALALLAADTFAIVNGDTLCDVDLSAMLADHRQTGAGVTMAVVPNAAPDRYNGVLADAAGVVTGFVPKGEAGGSWHFVGVQIVSASVFEPLPDGVPMETVAGVYRDLVASTPGRIRVWRTASRFLDVGTPADYLEAGLASLDVPTTAAVPGVTRSIVWPTARLGAGLDLDECVVIGEVRVPDGFQARRAIIAPVQIVEPDDRVEIHQGLAMFQL